MQYGQLYVSVYVYECAVWLRNFELNAIVSGVDNYDDDYTPLSTAADADCC